MLKNLKQGEKYQIDWLDTYNFLGWHWEDEIDNKTVDYVFQSTLGHYIKTVKDWYIFAQHNNPNESFGFAKWGNVVYIPKGCVKAIKKL
jgi:hypothetical protein